ncbi:TPA: hypothetical protein RQK93_004669 [Vibrio vulnificus]|nr:hypothetical protein [Vibrio parahaemolyticus]HDY8072357.1 hypothetical protein [Vibrio vulnificus]EGX6076733.1 hypothetical protein [Vibrio parahaemolyticus]EKG9565934.1 hypothetical protein [Vibrio parahaemolyticus]EKG9665939.1 hypothetical protein [Vibrio parahaemolyticus]
MSNVVDFVGVRKSKIEPIETDALSRVKEILSPKKHSKNESLRSIVKRVKGILRSKKIKYRVTHKSVDSKLYHKDTVLLFPEVNLIFRFSERDESLDETYEHWIVKNISFNTETSAIEYVTNIQAIVEELEKNG